MPESTPKIFVLDTSVVLYDSNAFNNFQEHDVAVPITVLEELDQFKKGNNVINLHARDFLRQVDRLSENADLRQWIPLSSTDLAEAVPINGNGEEGRQGRFKVVTANGSGGTTAGAFGTKKNDHRILDAAIALQKENEDRKVILVTKDINLRVKARALEVAAEDYETVKVQDVARLYTGKSDVSVPAEVIDQLYRDGTVSTAMVDHDTVPLNHFLILRATDGSKSALATYDAQSLEIKRVEKASGYGIVPRNAEQTFALHAILNPSVKLVTITGAAGTGKTLLALAGALEQRSSFRQIYLARPIVPLSNRDIGYLPGDISSKVSPYMQPLWDNLSVIKNQFSENDKAFRRIDEMVEREKLHIVPLTYIRGRSFSNIVFIIDEAQNLTPHEIKTVITRAGEGTKIIFTGDIFQIDTPYLDTESNGLSYLIDRIRDHPLYAHVTLEKGERSELANLASAML
ncbi:MAG: PhoH family protein [Acidobacteriota bacterium]